MILDGPEKLSSSKNRLVWIKWLIEMPYWMPRDVETLLRWSNCLIGASAFDGSMSQLYLALSRTSIFVEIDSVL